MTRTSAGPASPAGRRLRLSCLATLRLAMTAPHYHSHVDDAAAVGRRLKEARLAAGLSQRQLSFPGCSAAYISRLEAGDRVPSLQLLRKLAAKLNADEQYLATGVEQIKQDPPELIEAEVERRLAGAPRDPRAGANRPSGGLDDPVARARVLWEHSRALAAGGDRGGAARFARDALALLDFADDRRLAST
jgi:transcriptional regulator with XRE-family HTH domain